jgi:SOS-response transcriptional repressor LexA
MQNQPRVIDISKDLIPQATASVFYILMPGASMEDAGIKVNDVLKVTPQEIIDDGSIVFATVYNKHVIGRYFDMGDRICIMPANVNLPSVEVLKSGDYYVYGIVSQHHAHR